MGLPSGIVVSNKGHFKSQVELTCSCTRDAERRIHDASSRHRPQFRQATQTLPAGELTTIAHWKNFFQCSCVARRHKSIFLFENIETHENLFVIRALNRYGRKGPAYQSTKCSIAEQRIAARSGICEAARTVDTTLCGHRTVLTTDRRKRSSHRVARAEDQKLLSTVRGSRQSVSTQISCFSSRRMSSKKSPMRSLRSKKTTRVLPMHQRNQTNPIKRSSTRRKPNGESSLLICRRRSSGTSLPRIA